MKNTDTPALENVRHELTDARRRTLDLIAPLGDDDLHRQHDPLMSPIAWDLGHIGNFEELWGIRSLPRSQEVFPELDDMYDAVKHPRATRASLPLPNRSELLDYLDGIRRVLIGRMGEAIDDPTHSEHPLLRDSFVYAMLAQHEQQHNETILQTLQLKQGDPYRPALPHRHLPEGDRSVRGMVEIAGGTFVMGTDRMSGVYDNERPAHRVELGAYRIGRAPVSVGEYLQFVENGGYTTREYWSDEGWAYIDDEGIDAPKYWERDDEGEWTTRSMNVAERLNHDRPVVHVCWHEAEAYCRFVGMRLPTEAEWERAAGWSESEERLLLFPWGDEPWTPRRANLDMLGWRAAAIGAYPDGVSPSGCHQMIGDVWEWVADPFAGYPGFEAFPYDEYSKIFFGSDYRVLRGGSWATRPGAIRNTFRNWDFPIRRQIFSGFRVAADPL